MQWYMKWKRSLQHNEANLSMNEGTKGAQFSMLSLVSILQPPLCHDRDPTPKHRHGRQGKVGKRFALYYLCYLHQLCYWKKKKTNSCSEVQQIEGPHSGDLAVWHFEGSRPLLISNITLQLLESLSLISYSSLEIVTDPQKMFLGSLPGSFPVVLWSGLPCWLTRLRCHSSGGGRAEHCYKASYIL